MNITRRNGIFSRNIMSYEPDGNRIEMLKKDVLACNVVLRSLPYLALYL